MLDTDKQSQKTSTKIYYPILHDLPFLGLATSLFGSPNSDGTTFIRPGRSEQLGNVLHMTGGKMDMSDGKCPCQTDKGRECLQSVLDKLRRRECAEYGRGRARIPGYLRRGFDISTSSAQHQSSNPVLRRATALQFDIRASIFFTSCSWTRKRSSVSQGQRGLTPTVAGWKEGNMKLRKLVRW